MKKFIILSCGLLCGALLGGAQAAPSEVLSEVALIKKDGMDAVRLDFAIPVQYVSHTPAKRGSQLTINIRFGRNDVPDTSELPLMQSLYAPEGGPLTEVIFETIGGEPRLQLIFKKAVNFSVSQTRSVTSLLVLLPDKKSRAKKETPKPATKQATKQANLVIDKDAPDTETDLEAIKMMDEGRKALRASKYKSAIQTFTAVLSLPPNKFSQPALELLGVARERNNQAAQAKAVYEQYLEQYKDIEGAGEGVVRVRQRLAELLAAQLKPKKKLKEGPRAKREGNKKVISTFRGSFSQFVDYADTVSDSIDEVRYQSIDSQLSLDWRIRSKDWEVYNHYFGRLDYDTLEEDSEDVETISAYSRIKNRAVGIYSTLGRQRSSTAGVLGRFDGIYLGYDITPKIRLNGVAGYPVDTLNKGTIQTHKPMSGVGVDLSNIVKGLDVGPYYIEQQVDGITDREAVGAEVRYFQPKYNMYSRLDYDLAFSDINMFFLLGQYMLSKPTSVTLTFDHRANPLLETSNALISLDEEISIKDLLEGSPSARAYSASELQDIAKDRTGSYSILTLQLSHAFNARQQMTTDISRSQHNVKIVNFSVNDPTVEEVLDTRATETETVEYDISAQLVSSEVFTSKDMAINLLRYTLAETFDEITYRLAYRIPYQKSFTTEPRLWFRYRNNDSGEKLTRALAGLRLNYRSTQKLRLYLELNYKIWDYAGETNQEDFSSTYGHLGYFWLF